MVVIIMPSSTATSAEAMLFSCQATNCRAGAT